MWMSPICCPTAIPSSGCAFSASGWRASNFKDFRRAVGTIEGFVDLLEGDVDWPAVMSAIEAIGYDGPLVAEMIPLYEHYPEVRVANTSRAMDAILGRAA